MLRALELVGFKSFAEKTRFDFPDGITVIVGPNGSGKSNVVDAIKWVLGAQSAKALRGKDMIDVIFKGSAASGRKPANTAEATLFFDNSQKLLAIDAEEVQVTRRVYRSGEGEYLINGQACRLRDIRDLFRGTGVGVDAYSLIEQGKVDRMLQASPKDRRVIFEEAAGISRFNAKKAEAARRLERVDQNLFRLKDIVDEVRARLNTLKSQASKAQRYREMTTRLHELRLQLGWTEYSELSAQGDEADARLQQLTTEFETQQAELETARSEAQHSEQQLHGVASQCQQVEAVLQDALQRMAVNRNQQQSLRQRLDENQAQQTRQTARLSGLRQRAQAMHGQVVAAEQQLELAQGEFDQAQQAASSFASQVRELKHELSQHTLQHDTLRQSQVSTLREVSQQAAIVAQHENMLADVLNGRAANERRLHELQQAERAARQRAETAAARLKQIHQQTSSIASELSQQQQTLDDHRLLLATTQEEAAVLQGRLEGATERLHILEQLEQHLEGVDAGARHVLENARSSQDPCLQSIHGLVAELLEVDVDLAPLIDTALGPMSNALVLNDGQLIQQVRTGQLDIPGRLTLIRLDRLPQRRFGEKVQLEGVRGIIGRGDQLIDCAAEFVPLFRYLLGTTWLVDSLDVALELAHFRGAGLRFVTAACQLMEADGTLTLGALQSSAGLVSRRSEIQNTRAEIHDAKLRYQRAQGEIERSHGRVQKLLPTVAALQLQAKELEKEFAHEQAAAQNAVSRLDEIEQTLAQLQQELALADAKRSQLEPTIAAASSQVAHLQAELTTIERELQTHSAAIQAHTERLSLATEQHTAAQVELARAEQRLAAAKANLQQSTHSQLERQQEVVEATTELQLVRDNSATSELSLLQLTSQLAHDSVISEREEAQLETLAEQASWLRQARSQAAKRLDSATRRIDKLDNLRQTVAAEATRLRETGQSLLKRFQEDYSIDYEQLSQATPISDQHDREQLEAEAAGLRQDVASVGEINMAALAELDELQSRYDFLNGQYEDLQAAKESLQRIIHKINADSRRMFLETLEVIRGNFQKLYRKSFGGGNADIVLESNEDVLECGIDIVATPPGKTELSNSLLSGGEKALTAVALLLAIFQYKPSPFCVLDEVDAPFDEANIGRFVSVLTEFLDWTKFIIVTHSKKTMTAATTLYGVTMQESGVSKQVAVRFEDVNDKGEIVSRSTPNQRAA